MRPKLDRADRVVAQIASRQHGVISRAQLRGAGLSDDAIKWRLCKGRLHRVHRGVFSVGRADLSPHGRWLAAIKALGQDAVLSHRSAAELWGLLPISGASVHITIPRTTGVAYRAGIIVHRLPLLRGGDSTTRKGVPTTSVARTLADLAGTAAPAVYRIALREAGFRGYEIGAAAGRSDRTESELERRFLRLCHRHGLPRPEVGVRLGRFRVDFLWRGERVVVETDGWRAHRGRQAFEDDRDRDLELRSAGFTVVRLTHRQVADQPDRVAGALRRVLHRPAAS